MGVWSIPCILKVGFLYYVECFETKICVHAKIYLICFVITILSIMSMSPKTLGGGGGQIIRGDTF